MLWFACANNKTGEITFFSKGYRETYWDEQEKMDRPVFQQHWCPAVGAAL